MSYWGKREKKPTEPQEPKNLEEFEVACEQELGEVEKSFRERMQAETKRFRDMCDTEYWFCVCFTSRAQKEEFLRSVGMDEDLKYIDGRELAKEVRKPIKTRDMEFAKIKPVNKDYLDISDDLA